MNLSKAKIGLFFLAVAVIGALLYPRALFLAFMYEGSEDLARAESYYLDYLERHPHDKFASLRLAGLYNRMAEPERAATVLEDLYGHRKRDWKIAKALLNQLEEMHEEDALFAARLRVARDFKDSPRRQEAVFLFEDALQYALWNQDYPAAYGILADLEALRGDNPDYPETRAMLDRSLKKWDAVLARLRENIERDPKDMESRRDVVNVYVAKGDFRAAMREADAVLKDAPRDTLALQSRVFIATKLKERHRAIADIETLLNLGDVGERQRLVYRGDLAALYKEEGDEKRAMAIYQDLLRAHPENKTNWDNVLGMFLDKQDWNGAIFTLKSYFQSFPQDSEKRKQLVDIYLYELKEPNALTLYSEYLESVRDARFALDVAFLLVERKWTTRAETWLRTAAAMFPGDVRVLEALAGLYGQRKDYAAATALWEKILRIRPGDADTLTNLAQIRSFQGDRVAATALYERLAEIQPDFATRLLAGKEILFLGFAATAEPLLELAAAMRPDSAEAHFWLAELRFANDRKAAITKYALATDLLRALPRRSEDEERMLLKSRARMGFAEDVRAGYAVALARYPKNAELRADEIEALLEARDADGAVRSLATFEAAFPKESERVLAFSARLAFLRRDWRMATERLKELVAVHPLEWGYRRDLAEARIRSGHWKEAIRDYETVAEKDQEASSRERSQLRRTVSDLHDEYDARAEGEFRYVKLGGESFFENRASWSSWLSEMFKINVEAAFARYSSGSLNRDDEAVSGGALLSYRPSPTLTLKGGVGFGVSDARETVTPALGISWVPDPRVILAAEGRYQELRVDLPQAVARGTLTDDFTANARWNPVDRLTLSARYRGERNTLPGGQSSHGHLVEPAAAWTVLHEPYVTVGYQFTFADNSDSGGFLNLVGLIPRVEAHYLTAYWAQDFANGDWHIEGNAFWGEDTARDLHLFEADLFGAGARAEWRATRFLKLRGSYDFGRETLTRSAGTSHQVGVGVTGHW